jgi:hypothetical protein
MIATNLELAAEREIWLPQALEKRYGCGHALDTLRPYTLQQKVDNQATETMSVEQVTTGHQLTSSAISPALEYAFWLLLVIPIITIAYAPPASAIRGTTARVTSVSCHTEEKPTAKPAINLAM